MPPNTLVKTGQLRHKKNFFKSTHAGTVETVSYYKGAALLYIFSLLRLQEELS